MRRIFVDRKGVSDIYLASFGEPVTPILIIATSTLICIENHKHTINAMVFMLTSTT